MGGGPAPTYIPVMGGNDLLCLGFGYVAAALVRRLRHEAPGGVWRVAGTTRTPEKAAEMRSRGVTPLLSEALTAARAAAAEARHILVSAPPMAAGDPACSALGAAIAANPRLRWLGYLSATSVYGDAGGAWVDEEAPLAPTTERGRWRVAAEAQWRALAARYDLPLVIFRLAGVYGPGRSALDALAAGRARRIVKPGQVFNRIHVEDAARFLIASMTQQNRPLVRRYDPDAVYNLCDDAPAPSQDVVACAAKLLGIDPPPEISLESAELSPMARSFYAENKRLRNDRARRAFGLALAYPDYRSGLAALAPRRSA